MTSSSPSNSLADVLGETVATGFLASRDQDQCGRVLTSLIDAQAQDELDMTKTPRRRLCSALPWLCSGATITAFDPDLAERLLRCKQRSPAESWRDALDQTWSDRKAGGRWPSLCRQSICKNKSGLNRLRPVRSLHHRCDLAQSAANLVLMNSKPDCCSRRRRIENAARGAWRSPDVLRQLPRHVGICSGESSTTASTATTGAGLPRPGGTGW